MLKKLHLGCGPYRFRGFDNLDLELGHDLRQGLPGYADGCASLVYSSHFLEHLTYAEGRHLLAEVHRVLAPGGIVRLVVPDMRRVAEAYVRGDVRFARHYLAAYHRSPIEPGTLADDACALGALAPLYLVTRDFGHRALYDRAVLGQALAGAGFAPDAIREVGYNASHYLESCDLDIRYADHSLFMEAQKR